MNQQGTLLSCSMLFSFFLKSSSRLIYQSALLKWLVGRMGEWRVDSCSGGHGPCLRGTSGLSFIYVLSQEAFVVWKLEPE